MGQRHTIDTLEPEIRQLVVRLLERPRGVDEFAELANTVLEERGSEIRLSRSSAHRYMQSFEDERKALRETQQIMEAFGSDLEGMMEGDTGRVLVEMLRALFLRVVREQLRGDEPTFDSKDFMNFGRMLRDLTASMKGSADLEIQLRRDLASKLVAKLDDAEREATDAGEPGLSAARVAQLRRDFLGVRPGAAA